MVAGHSLTTLLAGCLLWMQHQRGNSWPLPGEESTTATIAMPTTIITTTEEPKQCSHDADCGNRTVVRCDESGKCWCRDSEFVWTSPNHCQPGKQLGENCKVSEQCQLKTMHSVCFEGVCACDNKYTMLHEKNATTCESDIAIVTSDDSGTSHPPSTGSRNQVDHNMIIIMVVLAVMFVGICVALHLFSKARFRNHRTIFNSPHPRLMHIKLGKKKGRRRASHSSLEVPGSRQLSICSQLSPVHSRRGSRATSPDFSRGSQRGTGHKKDSTSHGPDSSSMSSADDLLKKDPPRKTASELPSSSSAVPNGPGSPTVIVANGRGSGKVPSDTARV